MLSTGIADDELSGIAANMAMGADRLIINGFAAWILTARTLILRVRAIVRHWTMAQSSRHSHFVRKTRNVGRKISLHVNASAMLEILLFRRSRWIHE